MPNYYLKNKAERQGYLSIRDAAKYKGVAVFTVRKNLFRLKCHGSINFICYDEKFITWKPKKRIKKT